MTINVAGLLKSIKSVQIKKEMHGAKYQAISPFHLKLVKTY